MSALEADADSAPVSTPKRRTRKPKADSATTNEETVDETTTTE